MTKLNNFRYNLFHPQNPFNLDSIKISDEAFKFWFNFWNNVFAENKAKAIAKEDTYIKQDIIAAITYENKIVGLHLYTLYNLNSDVCAKNPYLKIIPEDKFDKFRQQKLNTGMAMEYLSVDPEFRKSKIGFSLGETLIGLGLKLIDDLNIDCVFGITRDDRGVDKVSEKFGGESFHSGFELHNTPCSFSVIGPNKKKSDDPLISNFMDKLWNQRNNYLNYKSNIQVNNDRIAS